MLRNDNLTNGRLQSLDCALRQKTALILALATGLTAVGASGQGLPAFPEAEGFGALAAGGRGGQVLEVTNLTDDVASPPAGSLRAAIDEHNAAQCFGSGDCPSTIVFEVAGTIELEAPLAVTAPYLTLAGQTAPGGGVTLRARPGDGNVDGYLLELSTHDVIVRHLRIRPGPGAAALGTELGGINIVTEDAHDIILDHLSISWAEDKAITIFEGPRDITVQNSILAETLGCANHRKSVVPAAPGDQCDGVYCCEPLLDAGRNGTPHSRLALISSNQLEMGVIPVSPENISFRGNLLANTNKRFPSVTSDTYVNFVNNAVYNFGEDGSILHACKDPERQHVELDYVRNYVRTGPWTAEYGELSGASRPVISVETRAGCQQADKHEVYEKFNVLDQIADEAIMRQGDPDLVDWLENPVPDTDDEPVPLTMIGAHQAFGWVKQFAGAFPRDSADDRIVTETHCRWGGIVDDPEAEVGGWPAADPGTPRADIDNDGMWDEWELAQNPPLVVGDPYDGNDDADGDGFTNLEEYLAERATELVGPGLPPGACVDVDPPSKAVIHQAAAVTSASISLDWYESKDRVQLDHYDVEVREASDPWNVAQSDLTASAATIDGLLPDTVHELRVLAFDASNPPSTSESASARTLLAPIDDFRIHRKRSTSVRLVWQEHPEATTYTLYRDGTLLVEGLTTKQYADTGLTPCQTYTWEAIAVRSTGEPNTSETATVTETTGGC